MSFLSLYDIFKSQHFDNTACKSNYNMLHFFYVTQDIMSVSEREQAMLVHRERRMAIMIAAYAEI